MDESTGDNLDLPAGDSFLDVIANLVGILVLLVVVVGVRSAKSAYEAAAPEEVVDLEALRSEAADKEAAVLAAVRDTRLAAQRISQVTQDTVLREITRQQYADEVAQLRQDIEDQRAKLDPDRRRSAEVQIELAKVEQRLDDLTAKQVALIGQIAQMEETPTKQVEIAGSSIAANRKYEPYIVFLKGGRVASLPGDELVQQVNQARRSLPPPNLLKRGQEFRRNVGPVEGFTLEIVFQHMSVQRRGGATVATRLKQCLLNMNGDLVRWEEIDEAIDPGSALMTRLAGIDAENTAVILQTAPDSYEEYQTLKTHLSKLGYSVVIDQMGMSGILPVVDAPRDGFAVQ